MKHTPGEWYSQVMGGDHDIDIYSGDTGKSIALVRGADEESKANARLIECAPELLATLKTCYAALSTYGKHPLIDKKVQGLLYDIENPA